MEQKTEQVGWNLAQHIVIELSNSLNQATQNYITGNYGRAASWLRAVRLRITPSLDEDELRDLSNKEQDLHLAINKSKRIGFKSTNENKIAGFEVFVLYGEYNDLLMACLKRYGYLIPEKENRTSLNA